MHPRPFLRTTYWVGFIFSFHIALTVYINSSFLATKIPESLIGSLYTASAILSIMGLFLIPQFISRYGSRLILTLLLTTSIASIIGMIYGTHSLIPVICFVLFFTCNTLIYLSLDIMIERWSSAVDQGTVRGTYLSLNSIGFMIAPLITGYIADRLGLETLYGFALLLLIPIIIIIIFRLPSVARTHPAQASILTLSKKFLHDRHLRKVFFVNFVLQFFYAWMVIYTPLYLHEQVGLSWDKIGILFTIMLSAFVIFEYITGKLADKFHIEKPMMIVGLLIMGITTLFITQAIHLSFIGLAALLFATRVGAGMVEVMTESYFFKHVHHDDVGSIGFFRNTNPFAYIIAPLVALAFLQFTTLSTLFIILGVLCIIASLVVIHVKHAPKYSR